MDNNFDNQQPIQPVSENQEQQEQRVNDASSTTEANSLIKTGKQNLLLFVKSNPLIVVIALAIVLMIGGITILGVRNNHPINIASQSVIKAASPKPEMPVATITPNPNIAPKVLGTCSTASTGNYIVVDCVNVQLPDSSSPSREIYIAIDPANDSPKSSVQTIATQANALCGTISDCFISIFDNPQAASEQYKEDLLSQTAVGQYIKDPKNSDAVSLTVDHQIASFTSPNDFTYLFIPPMPADTIMPTPTSIPTDSNGFPTDAEAVTVAQIAKLPSVYDGKKVTFTCLVSGFAKNEYGDAASLNCTDPNDISSILQVNASGWDLTKINKGDTVNIYGLGEGAATGKNAFGVDVTEAVVLGFYSNDLTSNYKN